MRLTSSTTLLFLAALPAWPRLDPAMCGTHALRAAEERALHRRAVERRRGTRSVEPPRTASRDIGHIAVLEDRGDIIGRRNPFNLNTRGLMFRPSGDAYRFELAGGAFDQEAFDAGLRLDLDDDDTREIAIGFVFPFYGQGHARVFVNSDGNLTFGQGDSASSERSLGRATSGPPRVSGFFEDLDPSRAVGSVRAHSDGSRLVVSWRSVPEYGASTLNTFQIKLYSDGRIEFAYAAVNSSTAVVGIAPGAALGQTAVVSFTGDSSGEYRAAVAERFANAIDVDIVFAAQRFYQTHPDSFDYLAFYNAAGITLAGAVAQESTVRTDRGGIGDDQFDDGRQYGSPRRLQAVLNMGPLSQYPRDPNSPVGSRGQITGDTSLSVLAHEAGHLWLAYAGVPTPGARNTQMLSPEGAHWAFHFNSEASIMEGNRIADQGETASPRFLTTGSVEAFAPLDQYMMGLRAPGDVPPTFYVSNPSTGTAYRYPQRGISIDGVRRDVTVEDLVRVFGPRTPDHRASQKAFRLALILITRAAEEPTAADIEKLEAIRASFPDYFARATEGRASADTTLTHAVTVIAGPLGVGESGTGRVVLTRASDQATTVLLSAGSGLVEVPGSVEVPAGETEATFPVNGLRTGIDGISATVNDGRLGPGWARVDVK
jgi:hypothetical protein